MKEKELAWYKIAGHISELQLAENNIALIEAGGKKICVARIRDRVFVFASTCPHAGGHLADGHIDILGNIVCPVHHYKYDLKNGRNISGEGYYLKNWPVDVRQDGVYVALEDRAGLNLF